MNTIQVETENGDTVTVSTGTTIDFADPDVKCFACGAVLIVLAFHPKLSKIIQTIFSLQNGVFVFNGLLDLIGEDAGVEAQLIGNGNTGGLVHTGGTHRGAHEDSRTRGTAFFTLQELRMNVEATILFDARGG